MATANLKELWGLLFEWPSSLTDEQIDAVLDAREELKEKIYIVWSGRLYCIECEKTHRLRKKELGGKTTEELLSEVLLELRSLRMGLIAGGLAEEVDVA